MSQEAAVSPGTVLVTGGSGYLGQFLVEDLAAKGWKVMRFMEVIAD